MIILFTGHRDKLCPPDKLDAIGKKYPDAVWMHGGARGFDSQVETYALNHGIRTVVRRPEYRLFGKAAPLVRNRQMLEECNFVIALYDGRMSGGTYFVIQRAREMHIIVEIILPEESK